MHTTQFMYTNKYQPGGEDILVVMHHDGDIGGDVKVQVPQDYAQPDFDSRTGTIEVTLPFEAMQHLVALKVQSDRIAAIEEMSDQELLSGRP